VVPALADRWIVTEDGQSYIFRLRNGVWPDGRRITGEDTARLLRRTLASLKGTALGLDLAPVEEIRAMAGRVVEIRLATPLPDLLDILAQPELGLVWNNKGAGPLSLERHGAVAVLRPLAPETRGLPAEEDWNERVRELRVRVEPAAGAVRRFDEGFADVVLGGTTDTLPLVRSFGLSRGNLRLDPVIGLFGLIVASPRGFLAEPENREAVAMAIDREALLTEFRVGGWVPTTRLVSSEVADDSGSTGERWDGLALADRQRTAAARVAAWKAAGGAEPVRVALPDSPGGEIIYDRLRSDLGAIGLSVQRARKGDPADLRLFDAAARYASTAWFLNQLSCAARRAVCSREGDDLLAAARTEPDPLRRKLQVAQAEAAITDANGFIPFARPLRWSLVRGDVSGFAINPRGLHPLLPLALAPR
jgi:oligopeptide transport system substrate-binding protein